MGNWWKHLSSPAKALIVLVVLLILQGIGCLATPALTQWYDAQFHIPRGEGWGEFGLVLWELGFCGLTALLLAIACVWWILRTISHRKRATPGAVS